MTRRADLDKFYDLLDELSVRTNGPRRLADCSGADAWPDRGVYFFFEAGLASRTPGEVQAPPITAKARNSPAIVAAQVRSG